MDKLNLRIGLLVPSSNTTMEREFWMAAPAGVTTHSSRMWIVDTTPEGLEGMDEDLQRAVELVATAGVDVICYGCTTGSLRLGKGHDRELIGRIEEISGIKAVATATAVVTSLREKGARKIVVATPYIEELDRVEKSYLEAHGFEVLEIKGLGVRPNLDIGRLTSQMAYELGRDLLNRVPEADALFISCTNFSTQGIVRRLEEESGRAVISSNKASLWMSLVRAGFKDADWGREW